VPRILTCPLLSQVIHGVVCWDVNTLAVDAREVDVDAGQQCGRLFLYGHDSSLEHSLTNNLLLAAAAAAAAAKAAATAALNKPISNVRCTAWKGTQPTMLQKELRKGAAALDMLRVIFQATLYVTDNKYAAIVNAPVGCPRKEVRSQSGLSCLLLPAAR
jgi:hypothetical protein